MKSRKEQWSVWLDPEVRECLRKRGMNSRYSRSALVNMTLRRALFPDSDDHGVAPLIRRLDRVTRQLERAQEAAERRLDVLEQRLEVLDQRVALFIQHWLTVSMQSLAVDEAAIVKGRQRHAQFEEQLLRRLAGGLGGAAKLEDG